VVVGFDSDEYSAWHNIYFSGRLHEKMFATILLQIQIICTFWNLRRY